jgi:hypothetical protein
MVIQEVCRVIGEMQYPDRLSVSRGARFLASTFCYVMQHLRPAIL